MRKLLLVLVVALSLGVGAAAVAAGGETGAAPTPTPMTESGAAPAECPICGPDLSGYAGPLSSAEVGGLLLALNDEYRAWALYDRVLKDFGQVRPFSNILRSEAQHIAALEGLFESYGLEVPNNPWVGNVPGFSSVAEASAAGARAEVENAALYDTLFAGTERQDILEVYRSLQRASTENHLPAFQRTSGQGSGRTQPSGSLSPRRAR